jgi:tetratricopeptide (TPR) repeat protein
MANWAADFEFVDGDDGGKFVSAGGSINTLRGLVGRGLVDEATAIYEELGGSLADALLDEAKVASSTTRTCIAEVFARARDFSRAARVFEMGNRHQDAGANHEKAGDFLSAAGAWQRANEPQKAAAAFERAGRTDLAMPLYQQSGAGESTAECLARQGRYLDAAASYRQMGNMHAEVELLRGVPLMDAQRPAAVVRLAELMAHYGHAAQAVPVLLETARSNPAAQNDQALRGLLIKLLDGLGRHEEAARLKQGFAAAQAPIHTPVAMAMAPTAADPMTLKAADGYAFLKAIPVFADLTSADMHDLYRIAQEASFPAGATILEQGVPGPGLAVIVTGNVQVLAQGEGGPRLLNTLGAGGYVGEISLILEGPTSARVVASTPVRSLLITRDSFKQFLFHHEGAAVRIYRLFTVNLAERVRTLSAAR